MPSSSQKGTGKKGAGNIRQRSRNTTPASSVPPAASAASLPPVEEADTEYLEVAAKLHLFQPITYDDLVDPISPNALIPDSKTLDAVINRLKEFGDLIEKRSLFCDLSMRAISQARSNEMQAQAHTETAGKGSGKKKRKAAEPPPDRSSPHRSSGKNARKNSRDNDSASSSLSPVAAGTPSAMDIDDKPKVVEDDSDSSDEEDGRPPPRQQPKERTFGEDPSTFPDPTLYEIRETTPGMSEEEKKEIYSVAVYPKSDLADLIAGDPPDKDFSNAKPSNQISFSTFATYIDPYFRPFTEEDLAFLRERNDRANPFVTPKRGKKHYTEIWAEEDGNLNASSTPSRERLPPNQPRGNIEQMDDEVAETDKLSLPPMVSRLLAAMRPEGRPPPSDDRPMTNGVNGDSANGDLDTAMVDPVFGNGEDGKPYPPATFFPESNNDSFRKGTFNRLDYNSMDERLKQELLYVGLASEDRPEPDYDAAYDDEVSARLRLLQERLREQILVNGARKARLTELVKERLAFQEYQTILEDLDGQVQAAYLKRTRTMGKSKKKSRPGQAVPLANTARPGIGDLTKTLMERRRKWIESVGPVVADEGLGKVPRSEDPDSSIFKSEVMAELIKKEKISWDEDVEEE